MKEMITSDKKKKKKKKKKKRPQQTIVNVFQVWTTCKEQYNNYFYTGIYMYMSIEVNGKKKKKVSNLEIQSTSILCVQLSISLVYLLFPLYIQFLQQRCFCCELQAGNKIKIARARNNFRIVSGHDDRPNSFLLGHVSFLAGQMYMMNYSFRGP